MKLKSSLPARVVDISAGGVQVEVGTSMRPGAGCELRVQVDGSEVMVRVQVQRCRAWGFGLDETDRRVLLYRAGLQFTDLSTGAYSALRRFFETPEAVAETAAAAAVEPVAGSTEEPFGEEHLIEERFAQAPEIALPPAPRSSGPVKIRINSEHIRQILRGKPTE